jgi:hypothetical protein
MYDLGFARTQTSMPKLGLAQEYNLKTFRLGKYCFPYKRRISLRVLLGFTFRAIYLTSLWPARTAISAT